MAARQPHAMAIVFPDGRDRAGRVSYTHLTYRQLDEESSLVAAGLTAGGIGRGVRTALMVRPSLELFVFAFGLLKAGAVPVLVDPGLGLRNIRSCLALAAPEAFIGVPAAHAARLILGWGRSSIRHVVTVGRRGPWGGVTLEAVLDAGRRMGSAMVADTASDELAAIVFTSGSTGPPKGVEYRHGNFAAQIEAIRTTYGMGPGEVDLPTFPLFALFDPALGMTTVVPDMDPTRPAHVDPSKIVEAIEDFGVTNMFGSPALLNRVGRWGVEHGITLPSIKRVISAGAPVPAAIMERFLRLLGEDAQVHTPYGATESLPVATISSSEVLGATREATDAGRGVCVGPAVESIDLKIIRISDEPIPSWSNALEVEPGEVGEITVKGPQVTRAYFRSSRHTELAKIEDPSGGFWHRMGDLGYLDEQGRVWFCGRKAHRVVTGQGTLYSVPCESVFNSHADVYRSALVGVDRGRGMEPAICIELEPESASRDRRTITRELLELGQGFEHTERITDVLYHPDFPVDIRHNTKIGREQLAVWAAEKLK